MSLSSPVGAIPRMYVGEKVRLRPVTEADVDRLVEWDQDDEIARWMGKKFKDKQEARMWYLAGSGNQRMIFAIETLWGRLIGEIEVLNISWKLHTAEMRIFIGDREFQNKGYGRDAVQTLLSALFRETALDEVYLRVDSENKRAIRCYTHAGFKLKGQIRFNPGRDMPERMFLMAVRRDSMLAD